jgi:hypothetical protein
MAKGTIQIQVTTAWWLKFYLYGVSTIASMMGVDPDWRKVDAAVRRAMRVRFGR